MHNALIHTKNIHVLASVYASQVHVHLGFAKESPGIIYHWGQSKCTVYCISGSY